MKDPSTVSDGGKFLSPGLREAAVSCLAESVTTTVKTDSFHLCPWRLDSSSDGGEAASTRLRAAEDVIPAVTTDAPSWMIASPSIQLAATEATEDGVITHGDHRVRLAHSQREHFGRRFMATPVTGGFGNFC